MNIAFVRAFEAWENEFRANPEQFMTSEAMAATAVLPLSEQRSVYFEAILQKLADAEPSAAIGTADA